MLQGKLRIYPPSLAVRPSLKGCTGWKGSVCAAVPALMCYEVLCADKRARLCRGVGWPASCGRSLRAVCEQGGAQGHLASSIAQRQPGSRAGRQDTALDLLQGLLSLAWSLHLASWHLRCARVALQRLCPVHAGPVTRLGGHWESSLQQRQGLSCSPTTATATGTDFFLKICPTLLGD